MKADEIEIITADVIVLDAENRIAELEKERPNYKHISGVGFYWDANKDEQFIEYCRLRNEHERLSKC